VKRVFFEKPYKIETIQELRDRSGVELVEVRLPAA
jgi:hypothetical protein